MSKHHVTRNFSARESMLEDHPSPPAVGTQAHAPPLLPGASLEIDIFQMELTSQLGLGS